MSRSVRIPKDDQAGATQSAHPALEPRLGRTPDGLRSVSLKLVCRRRPSASSAKTPTVVSARRTRLSDGACTQVALASSSIVRGSGPRISARPRRATTWIDWTTNALGQISSISPGKATSHSKVGGHTEACTISPYGGSWRTALMMLSRASIKDNLPRAPMKVGSPRGSNSVSANGRNRYVDRRRTRKMPLSRLSSALRLPNRLSNFATCVIRRDTLPFRERLNRPPYSRSRSDGIERHTRR